MTDNNTYTLKQTALHSNHVALGAKMVNFGGWSMPIQYNSQLEEHFCVRKDVGMFDVSHMCIVDLTGKAVKEFLLKLLANDVNKLKVSGKALYTCMLNHDGGVIDDLIVYYFNDEFYRLVINAGCAEKDTAWINPIAKSFSVNVEVRNDLSMIAVQGPKALELFNDDVKNLKPFHSLFSQAQTLIARTGYTGEDGVEIMLPHKEAIITWEALLKQGVKPCGLGARDTLRLEAGMNLYGNDMDENILPHDAGLSWTLSFKEERDFIGKYKLQNTAQKYQFLGLILQESGGILRAHQTVISEHGNGEITSGGYSPNMQQSIALARLPLNVKIDDIVKIQIRDKQLNAKVVNLPFVRHGKILAL